MDVEDVARVGLTARRIAQQQRKLPINDSVAGQIVDNQQCIATAFAEVLRHRTSGVWREPLQSRRIIRRGDDKDAPFRRTVTFNRFDYLGNRRRLLPDRAVDADDARVTLVDDRIDGDRSLARFAVANN